MFKKLLFLFSFLIPVVANAAGEFRTTDEILRSVPTDDTTCATQVYADALANAADIISENDSEDLVREWVYSVFQDPEVLVEVMSCPEVMEVEEDTTIKFQPISYTFPNGRQIIVNYQTQPKVLEQYFNLAFKTELPTDDPNPAVTPDDPNATWVNVDPAWYAIMVTQAGALDKFVGADKNNTVSFKYIEDNIDQLYPRGNSCSAETGVSSNGKMVNKVIRKKTAAHDGKEVDADFYIAGDRNLEWISYMEVAIEVAVTVISSVVTFGGAAAIAGVAKAARIKKITKLARANIEVLIKNVPKVKSYAQAVARANKQRKNLERMTDLSKNIKEIEKLEKKLAGAPKGSKKAERLQKQLDNVRKVHQKNTDILSKTYGKDIEQIKSSKDFDKLKDFQKNVKDGIKTHEKEMSDLAKGDKDIAEYNKQVNTLREAQKAAKELRSIKQARTGNIFSRAWQLIKNTGKSIRAANNGMRSLDKAAHVVRKGSSASGKARDWLFHSSMRFLGKAAKVGEQYAVLNFALSFIGDMYDYTSSDTGDYTNNIKMKPLLLLSADETSDGSESNVVNYGVWLMWHGDAISAEDDDAAYLQAMDFAQKFYQDLVETQTEEGEKVCDVDIYVVRPIIRNPGTEHQALYWLIMNEKPWSTSPR